MGMESLKVKPGYTVLIGQGKIAKVISTIGGARDPDTPSLIQVANIDTGEIHYVNASEINEIIAFGKV